MMLVTFQILYFDPCFERDRISLPKIKWTRFAGINNFQMRSITGNRIAVLLASKSGNEEDEDRADRALPLHAA